jgi:dethiobiotin synthetase
VRKSHENPSIGLLLCKSKDDEIVEYAMSRQLSPTLIADYETKLIDKKLLKNKLHDWFIPKR